LEPELTRTGSVDYQKIAKNRPVWERLAMRVIGATAENLDAERATPSCAPANRAIDSGGGGGGADDAVCVYISTYNGERYLRRQLDTILGQTGVRVELHVRDDGSTDGTTGILDEYVKGHSCINIYRGENLGFGLSFYWLVRNVPTKAPYFSFADQDDVWDADYLQTAIHHINKERATSPDRPVLYCCISQFVDSNENPIRCEPGMGRDAGRYALLAKGAPGHTMVYNAKLNDLMMRHQPSSLRLYMHDRHVLFLASYLGEIVFDNRPHQLWRRHGDSVTSASHATRFSEVRLVKGLRLFLVRLRHPHKNNFELLAKEILGVFSEDLEDSKRDKLHLVATYRQSLATRFRLLRDKEFFAGLTLRQRLFYQALVLCGAL
jgi:rhamnosyltransferase